MTVRFHPHAIQRMRERGATRAEVLDTLNTGRAAPARFGRTRFRKRFPFDATWNNKRYSTKQVDGFAVKMPDGWFAITVIVRYF